MQGNHRLYCLPKEMFCHVETSAFYLKRRRGDGGLFEIDSLGLEHQRENKLGMKVVSVL